MGLPDLLTYWMQHLVASSFMVLNSSTGIPSHPLDVLTAGTEFLTASVPEWFAVLSSSWSRVVRALRCDPFTLGGTAHSFSDSASPFATTRQWSLKGDYHYRYGLLCVCYSGPLILSLPIYCYFFETGYDWILSILCFKWVPIDYDWILSRYFVF